ncbi:inosine/xanthosine triphosphatase [Aliidiomarina quisquiliarum]|uniref:inosine/xanthosine triphosphatase n=1 Tax=Aliidiomarina quisquiliarum TaxID=2938947 RepID=UPI00208E4D7B|nr:inosine/xanthosine triphosphatase [Aliidiomarina quisquiliarum]MCO4322664.1 inosine/xanthosine triphosphatase [Aliidiomarina quisquiliarum]
MSVLKVIVGSNNPVKINSAKAAIQAAFPTHVVSAEGVQAPSAVSDQPMSEAETLAGARNRVSFCRANYNADFYVAFEGGVERFDYGIATFAYVVVANEHYEQVGRTSDLPIPDVFYAQLLAGYELGDVLDQHFNTENVKQKGGAIALLTHGLETRESTYIQALTLALAPFVTGTLFQTC